MNYIEINVAVEAEGDPFHRRTLEARLATKDVPPTEAIEMYMLGDMVVALRKLADEIEERLPEQETLGEAYVMQSPSWPHPSQ